MHFLNLYNVTLIHANKHLVSRIYLSHKQKLLTLAYNNQPAVKKNILLHNYIVGNPIFTLNISKGLSKRKIRFQLPEKINVVLFFFPLALCGA